jgi:hypothetical protein
MVGDARVCRTSSVLERCSPLSLLRDRATEESEMNNFERDEAIDLDFKIMGLQNDYGVKTGSARPLPSMMGEGKRLMIS